MELCDWVVLLVDLLWFGIVLLEFEEFGIDWYFELVVGWSCVIYELCDDIVFVLIVVDYWCDFWVVFVR